MIRSPHLFLFVMVFYSRHLLNFAAEFYTFKAKYHVGSPLEITDIFEPADTAFSVL